MTEKLVKLINVKSLMTLLITGVFCWLSVTGAVTAQQFTVIYTTIVAFYFGTQAEKKQRGGRG